MVLLKNVAVPPATTKLLPLNKAALKKVCVLGPLADATEHMVRLSRRLPRPEPRAPARVGGPAVCTLDRARTERALCSCSAAGTLPGQVAGRPSRGAREPRLER